MAVRLALIVFLLAWKLACSQKPTHDGLSLPFVKYEIIDGKTAFRSVGSTVELKFSAFGTSHRLHLFPAVEQDQAKAARVGASGNDWRFNVRHSNGGVESTIVQLNKGGKASAAKATIFVPYFEGRAASAGDSLVSGIVDKAYKTFDGSVHLHMGSDHASTLFIEPLRRYWSSASQGQMIAYEFGKRGSLDEAMASFFDTVDVRKIGPIKRYGAKKPQAAKAAAFPAYGLAKYGVCLMEVVVDSDYFAKRCGGSIANCTADAIALARTADLFYRRVDLTASGQPEGIGFRAQWVTVIQSAETDETSAVPLAATGTKDRIGLQNAYIKATQSREPQPGSCIRAWLTNRDFKGTRGFATIGSNCRQIDKRRDVCETCKANPTVPDAYFGVCSTDYRHHLLVVSYFNQTREDIEFTIVHELGHSLGASHDGESGCMRDTADFRIGPDLMYFKNVSPAPTTGRLSSCSKRQIKRNLDTLATLGQYCLVADSVSSSSKCGNGVVDEGEACDCGDRVLCQADKCCEPSGSPRQCQLKKTANCTGTCCTDDCEWQSSGAECGALTECRVPSVCNGTTHTCELGQERGNNTRCLGRVGRCINGECTSNLCFEEGQLPCQCEDKWEVTTMGAMVARLIACELCCRDNATAPCTKPIPSYTLPVGAPCMSYQGSCISDDADPRGTRVVCLRYRPLERRDRCAGEYVPANWTAQPISFPGGGSTNAPPNSAPISTSTTVESKAVSTTDGSTDDSTTDDNNSESSDEAPSNRDASLFYLRSAIAVVTLVRLL